MLKKIKVCFFAIIAIFAVTYFFDTSVREIFSTIQTVVVDNIEAIFPGAKGQFEIIDTQISSAIIKNGTTKTVRSKTQKAKKEAQAFINQNWIKLKRLALKHDINIDNLLVQAKKKFKYKYYKRQNTHTGNSSNYSFDYKNMSIDQASAMRLNFINCSLGLYGIPYVYGSENPSRGLDCSSFVRYSAKKGINVDLPRTAHAQYQSTVKIPFSEREPGDLLFFRSGGRIEHVGIYLGRYEGKGSLNGKEIFINAASAGPRTGVTISSLDAPYWQRHYNSTGRFLPSSKEIVQAAAISGK